jgi:hypothetical protein
MANGSARLTLDSLSQLSLNRTGIEQKIQFVESTISHPMEKVLRILHGGASRLRTKPLSYWRSMISEISCDPVTLDHRVFDVPDQVWHRSHVILQLRNHLVSGNGLAINNEIVVHELGQPLKLVGIKYGNIAPKELLKLDIVHCFFLKIYQDC